MKRQDFILHKIMLAMFVMMAAGIGQAQYGTRATIPFDFAVGTQTFPAGVYKLVPSFAQTSLLRNEKRGLIYIRTNSVVSREESSSARLIFHQYGGHYFLAQIWDKGSVVGQELPKSHAEIEMAKAQNSPGQQIALNLATHP